jgi:CDP-6-deoxy-D-xylo-4-hexulose-3-dehydrase
MGSTTTSNKSIDRLKGVVELYIENEKRNNVQKGGKYWYPLSLATYGVDEIVEALDSMCNFATSMDAKTRRFESEFSEYVGVPDSVMVNSGSSADLLLSFLLSNPYKPLIKDRPEVIVPVVTWPTHIWSIMMAGLKPVFVDVDPKTLNLDLKDLERKITPKTGALFLVHLMGNPCNMDVVCDLAKKHNLFILEDCCEALGSTWRGKQVGSFGLGGAYSFFFSHHMMTMEGGMITAQDKDVGEQLRILRAHGWIRNVDKKNYEHLITPDIDPRYAFVNWGFNVRPMEVQAGFGIHQLTKLPAFNAKRKILANAFFKYIAQYAEFITTPYAPPEADPAWFSLPMVLTDKAPFSRKDFLTYLEALGVETRPMVAGNIAKHPVHKLFPAFSEGSYPGADIIHERGFYIGLTPFTTADMLTKLVQIFEGYLNKVTNIQATQILELDAHELTPERPEVVDLAPVDQKQPML